MLQENRTRLLPIVQQTSLNLAHRSKKFFRWKRFMPKERVTQTAILKAC